MHRQTHRHTTRWYHKLLSIYFTKESRLKNNGAEMGCRYAATDFEVRGFWEVGFCYHKINQSLSHTVSYLVNQLFSLSIGTVSKLDLLSVWLRVSQFSSCACHGLACGHVDSGSAGLYPDGPVWKSNLFLSPSVVTLLPSATDRNPLQPTKVKLSRPWTPIGLWAVEAHTFSRQSAHRWRWDCHPYAPAALYPHEDSWYSFLLETESTPGL
jgi:hypothetical protein